MTLKNLLTLFGKIHWQQTSPDAVVSGVTSDSREVKPGFVFVAVRGVTRDGHDFFESAIRGGALALVVENRQKVPSSFSGVVVEVLDGALAYSQLLGEFYLHPEEKLISIGITGTNGKTSSSYLIEAILNSAGIPCGVMGTIDHHFQQQSWKSGLTTPDTATFYQRLQDFVDLGAKAYVMEVSSHSLKQNRVPTLFDVGLFTNFTRDHLDYHLTMDDYFASKEKLFTQHLKTNGDAYAILNADDEAVKKTRVSQTAQTWTFAQKGAADFQYTLRTQDLSGCEFEVREKSNSFSYRTPMIGAHNVANCVGAIAVARGLGVSHEVCKQAMQNFSGVPGRLQRVPNTLNKNAFIDYAHTPDALEQVLTTLKTLQGSAQLITVFGCGGDRDRGKRPLMREVAEKFSSQVIVTSDNPRSEDPQAIIEDILQGKTSTKIMNEVDRYKALQKAVAISRPGDIILIAGKGHENTQTIGKDVFPFSDYDKIKELLNAQ